MRGPLGLAGLGAVAVIAAGATGCGDRARPGDPVVVRDSAGVRIVESRAPAWASDGERWRLGGEPEVEIGVVDGPGEYQFSRVIGAYRLDDGRIVVGDMGAPEGSIRFFGPDGAFLRRIGASGSGPGEIGMLLAFAPYRGDSIAAWDATQSRLTIFDGEGEVGRTTRIQLPAEDSSPPPAGAMVAMELGAVAGFFADGSLFAVPSRASVPGESEELRYYRLAPEGEVLDTIGPLERKGRPPLVEAGGIRLAPPFPPQLAGHVGGERYFAGSGEDYEIRIFGLSGELEAVLRAAHRERPVDGEAREAYRDTQRARASDDDALRGIEAALREVEFPETLPPWESSFGADFRADAEGHLWVPWYRLPDEEGPRRWDVFDPDGRLLGVVETPDRFRVWHIGTDFVLGTWTDGLDVPFVRLYRLGRG